MNTRDNCIKVSYSAAWILSEKSPSLILIHSLFLCTALSIYRPRGRGSGVTRQQLNQRYWSRLRQCSADRPSIQHNKKKTWSRTQLCLIFNQPKRTTGYLLQIHGFIGLITSMQNHRDAIFSRSLTAARKHCSHSFKIDLWHAIHLNLSVFSVKWEPRLFIIH